MEGEGGKSQKKVNTQTLHRVRRIHVFQTLSYQRIFTNLMMRSLLKFD